MDEKKQPLVDGWLFYVNVLGHNKNCWSFLFGFEDYPISIAAMIM